MPTLTNAQKASYDKMVSEISNGKMTLKSLNPTVEMEVENNGTEAQMQVIDASTKHLVATFAWVKPHNSIIITLLDPSSGHVINEFRLEEDGKGYINGKEIATLP